MENEILDRQDLKDTKRAERRHHYSRLKKKRALYFGGVKEYYYQRSKDGLIKVPVNKGRELGMRVGTAQRCSCLSCGNPRNHIKSIITLKEHIALYTYADGIEEYFGWRPRITKFTKWW